MPATTMTTRWRRISSSRSISRHKPATPTSQTSVAFSPANASVRSASPATARSDVPPQTIATRPLPARRGQLAEDRRARGLVVVERASRRHREAG